MYCFCFISPVVCRISFSHQQGPSFYQTAPSNLICISCLGWRQPDSFRPGENNWIYKHNTSAIPWYLPHPIAQEKCLLSRASHFYRQGKEPKTFQAWSLEGNVVNHINDHVDPGKKGKNDAVMALSVWLRAGCCWLGDRVVKKLTFWWPCNQMFLIPMQSKRDECEVIRLKENVNKWSFHVRKGLCNYALLC